MHDVYTHWHPSSDAQEGRLYTGKLLFRLNISWDCFLIVITILYGSLLLAYLAFYGCNTRNYTASPRCFLNGLCYYGFGQINIELRAFWVSLSFPLSLSPSLSLSALLHYTYTQVTSYPVRM